MRIKKYIKYLLLANIGLFSSCNFAPGSYPYAEIYDFQTDELQLVNAVKEFKRENPTFEVPKQTNLIDGKRNDIDDHWYHVYFYYQDTNQIISTWIRKKDDEVTSLALIAINDGLRLGNWKYLNKDFSDSDNIIQKKKFENSIIKKVNLIIYEKKGI